MSNNDTFLQGFKPFDFSEGVPQFSITENGITFNKSCVIKLNYPSHTKLWIDHKGKKIALQPCAEGEQFARDFCDINRKRIVGVRWNVKALLLEIEQITGWSIDDVGRTVEGIFIASENLILFDLNKAKEMR